MRGKRIVFAEPEVVRLEEFEFGNGQPGDGEVAIETQYSILSAGTELAILRGTERWAPLPFVPGYGAVGRVTAVGDGERGVAPGDRLLCYTPHASHSVSAGPPLRVPDDLDGKKAVFARMGAVAMTALRVSDAELGDCVAVTGLGLVGNLAAQLFRLSGCQVIGIDPSARRREIAARCGTDHLLDPEAGDLRQAVADITDGEMCAAVVEATGIPAVAEGAFRLAGKLGEVILLGSPRGEYVSDITAVLNQTHLWNHGCVTVKGAHEWRYPVRRNPEQHVKHSIERNIGVLFQLMLDGKLDVTALITHVLSPTDCGAAYAGVRNEPDQYLGVVFDWSLV
ncbi:MAG TPA: zinc-binding alcohol dehydrogenase [Anaerolineae bacterium]|nr:zinc-binding alcohol dehydrogenase [Anaerolineae bacterium]